ncbi:adenylate/guanylate cyclase domain-containing protein [Chitinimonas sp.]|uniref:adenylate/guanylate cyclase domain-containing protein n=1 Tax=Chitinimonas sp. TaxID=1934313 RepID=UPI002F95E043
MKRLSLPRSLQAFSWWHALAAFAVLVLLDYGLLQASAIVDQRGGDVLLRLHAQRRAPSSEVVVVDIDQRSLEEMNEVAGSWPWPRSVHGELIEHLNRLGAKAIVSDILTNEVDSFRLDSDRYYMGVLSQASNVYLPQTLNEPGMGQPIERFPRSFGIVPTPRAVAGARIPLMVPAAALQPPESAEQALPLPQWQRIKAGLINFNEDSDQVGRHYHVYMERLGWRFLSLPAKLATDLGWPLPRGSELLLNWRPAPPHVSYADVYLDSQREVSQRPHDEFRGKIVVIGARAPGLQDLRVTPLSSLYPGVDILATAIDNLRQGDWLREPPRQLGLPLALLLLLGVALAFSRGMTATRIGYGLLGVNGLVLGLAWWGLQQGWWLPFYAPLVCGWVFYWLCALLAYLKERQQRERAIGMFQRFLDPRVVGDLVARGEIDTGANAESREVTVLFSDIRGFTTLSETRTPEAIVSLLNRYFSTQVEIIFRHGGTLDKFIGDAIMAFWGAPVNDPDHARHAILAAIEMSAALDRFKAELTELGSEFDIGIGLNTGPAVVGFIGSNDRLDYTAIGDTVNLASRIEGQTKGVARVLVAESTMQAAGEAFSYRDCGSHHVKGREQEVRLYEPGIKQ